MRQEPGGLARHPRPRRAGVGALVDVVLLVGHADVDGPGRLPRRTGALVEGDPEDALVVVEVPVGITGVLGVVARVGERGHLGPGHAGVRAAPQAVAAGRAEVQGAVAVGVDRQPLPHAPARHVAADLERQRGLLPGGPAVGGPQDGAVVGVPAVGVHARGDVHPVRVDRVGRQARDAVEAPVGGSDVVEQGDPPAGGLVPPVRAADVGARVHQVLLGLVEHDAGDEAAARDLDVAPRVGGLGLGRLRRPGRGRDGHESRGRHRREQAGENSPHRGFSFCAGEYELAGDAGRGGTRRGPPGRQADRGAGSGGVVRVRPRRCRAVTGEGARERRHVLRRLRPSGLDLDPPAPRGPRRTSGDARGRAPRRSRPDGARSPAGGRPLLDTGAEPWWRRPVTEVGGGGLVVPPGVRRTGGYGGRHDAVGDGTGRRQRDRCGAAAVRERGTWHECSSVRRCRRLGSRGLRAASGGAGRAVRPVRERPCAGAFLRWRRRKGPGPPPPACRVRGVASVRCYPNSSVCSENAVAISACAQNLW